MQFNTARGRYRLASTGEPERLADAVVMTLALEQADGVERVAFRCRIDAQLLGDPASADIESVLARLAPFVEREFEQTRESALKSIRSERKLLEIVFDPKNRGPF